MTNKLELEQMVKKIEDDYPKSRLDWYHELYKDMYGNSYPAEVLYQLFGKRGEEDE